MKKVLLLGLIVLLMALSGCSGRPKALSGDESDPTVATFTSATIIPNFDHVILIIFENRSYDQVIGNKDMPFFNSLAKQYVLLSGYYAVSHPSLPNYIALIGGSTFGINKDCIDCFLNQPSLPDLLEKSGRTWKTYQEDMPAPCFLGNSGEYAQKHNPFVYFDPIRLDATRCKNHVVPLTQLNQDLRDGKLPDFVFISPNLCHSGHDCGLKTVDQWLAQMVKSLLQSSQMSKNSLIAITFDEGDMGNKANCCGLEGQGGGQVATVLISPGFKQPLKDDAQLSHYSLLKTILTSWGLPPLGKTNETAVKPITEPWER